MIVAEYFIQWAINVGLTLLKSDASHLTDVLEGMQEIDPDKFDQAQNFFSNQTVPVIMGWPDQEMVRNPVCVAITVSPRREDSDYIGNDLDQDRVYDNSGQVINATLRRGFNTRANYNITVYGVNQDLVIWMSNVVWWSLQQFRDNLTEIGFMTQTLSQADASLDPRFQGQPIYRRVTTFSALVQDSVSIQKSTVLKHIYVEAIDPEDEQNPHLPND